MYIYCMAKKLDGKKSLIIGIVGGVVALGVLVTGAVTSNIAATRDVEQASKSVSALYLNELAARREEVVATNIQGRIYNIYSALSLMDDADLSSEANLNTYQANMKEYFGLTKFAFVGSNGIIYTASDGRIDYDTAPYDFDYNTLAKPHVSIYEVTNENRVVIAVPVPDDKSAFSETTLKVCFMEIGMKKMLEGVSLKDTFDETDSTFCNIYTASGNPLTGSVLGKIASENNLLDAMNVATYQSGYSASQFTADFQKDAAGIASFSYNGIGLVLSYVPIKGSNNSNDAKTQWSTDWRITYLVKESTIAEKIAVVSSNTTTRNLIIAGLIAVVLIVMFVFVLVQTQKNARMKLASEAQAIESKVKQEELESRLALQDQLIEQNKLITALASDYWSVYYIELDKDEGVCYQSHGDVENGFKQGEVFSYLEAARDYANSNVSEKYREGFLEFVKPENLKKGLANERVISYRYTVNRNGKESYEMIKVAGVRHPEDRDDGVVHAVGVCFTNVDEETKASIARNEMLSSALQAAEQASKAKTTFLSNMSHEIRTPMNAIIGLDNIALNDPNISLKTKDYLEKIGVSAEHLLNLINDILDMSRIESGRTVLKKESFSFSKLIEYINTMFSGQAQEKGLEYNCQVHGHVDDRYVGDNLKIRQILINLLGNAIKFTNAGGKVDLIIEKTAEFEGKSTLKFVVKDTGIGVGEEFLPHIFESFAQENAHSVNKYGSSGLGLAITKNIVEMMNGNITVESKKGEGTSFTVILTLDNDTEKLPHLNSDIKPEEMRVLIVDDDLVAAEHAKLVLEKAGITPRIVTSGQEAIDEVTAKHDSKEPYNLILIDWKMPDMDGVETTRRIKKVIGNESAIVILTAYRWDDVLDEAIQAGVDSFIPKPLFATSVIEEFKDAISRKESLKKKGTNKTSLSGKRILVAEDVEINAEIMKATLEMREMEVEIAENGLIALNMFSSHPENYYSAILMDMMMPEMDGLEATKRIRSLARKDAKAIPIIALTANAFDEDVQRSLQAGLNAHLSKPVKPEVVFETLEAFIKE